MVLTRRAAAAEAESNQNATTASSAATTAVAAAAAPSTTAKAATDNISPFAFGTHFAKLFATRSSSSSSALSFASLDGYRSILCLWMIAFHSFFYIGHFISAPKHAEVGLHPSLLLLNLGFLPVDGFFVLTGFLIAYPIFASEKKKLATVQVDDAKSTAAAVNVSTPAVAEDGGAQSWSFDVTTFWYRRVTRMLPSYMLSFFFYCGCLFPVFLYEMKLVRNGSFIRFMNKVLPDQTYVPSHCSPNYLLANFTFINHLIPFGGCMGWTWSFALQFNFYLFFPIFIKLAYRNFRATSKTHAPSSRLLPWMYGFLPIGILARFVEYFHLRLWPLQHEESMFLQFFWYANTLTRVGTLIMGVLAAYHSVHGNLIQSLRSNTFVRRLCWLLLIVTILMQMFWNRIFADGNMIETPGSSAIRVSQLSGAPLDFSLNGIEKHWHHMLFHAVFLVGSPVSSFIFTFVLLVTVNKIGSVGSFLNSVCSWRGFSVLSSLSFWAYLLHPTIMTRIYVYLAEQNNIHMTVFHVFYYALIMEVASFGIALVLYVFFEQPMEVLLRQSEANGTPSRFYSILKKLIFWYCNICVFVIVCAHLAMYLGVSTSITPKPHLIDLNDRSFRPTVFPEEDVFKQ